MKYKIIDEEGKVWNEFSDSSMIEANVNLLEQWHPGLRFTLIGVSDTYKNEDAERHLLGLLRFESGRYEDLWL